MLQIGRDEKKPCFDHHFPSCPKDQIELVHQVMLVGRMVLVQVLLVPLLACFVAIQI